MSAAAWPFDVAFPGLARADGGYRAGSRPKVATGSVVAHTARPMPRRQHDADTADEDLMLRYAAGDVAAFDV
ncbi:MAG: hypothetical protein ABIS68_06370, partial [Casimicrobiaceae bacterium]